MPSFDAFSESSAAPEQVWQELELLLDDLAAEARRSPPIENFYTTLAQRLTTALAAHGCAVWLRRDGKRMQLVAETNHHTDSIADRTPHEALLATIAHHDGTRIIPPHTSLGPGIENPTDDHLLLGTVHLSHWLAPPGKGAPSGSTATAIVELALPSGRAPSSYLGAEEVVAAACDTAAELHARAELAQLRHERYHRDALLDFAHSVSSQLDLQPVAMAIANEGRRVANCDRLSVVVLRGRSPRLVAVSGADHVERRGRAARGLEALARHALRLNEEIYYSDGQIDALPQVADQVHQYVDEFHARHLVVVPMQIPAGDPSQPNAAPARGIGVLVAEQFTSSAERFAPQTIAELARHATPALAHALAWRELPFGTLLRSLAWLRKPRTLLRGAAALLAVAAVAAALVLIQAPLHVDVRGQLLPVVRQEVFAPRSGIVEEVAVSHSQQVTPGELLLTLRDPDLAIEIERIAGQTNTIERQLEAIRATRTTLAPQGRDAVEAYRLSAQEEELKTELASLARQRELLQSEQAKLAVTSPIAGKVITWQVEERLATRPVERGQVLLSVADTDSQWQLELEIPDDQIDYLRHHTPDQPLRVEYHLGSDSTHRHHATLTHLAERADLVALPTGEQVRQIIARAAPDAELSSEVRAAALRPGGSVRARIVCGNHSLGYVWLHKAWRALRNWWEF